MKKTFTTLALLFISGVSFAQQIGSGFGPSISNFTTDLKSGVYSGLNPVGMTLDNSYTGWQHLFVLRHDNPDNNHQLQIASSFSTNDRLFFRKIAVLGSLSSSNPSWVELATRGGNSFVGNQIINGNVGIGITSPNTKLAVVDDLQNQFVSSFIGGKNHQNYKYTGISIGESMSAGNSSNIGYMSHQTDKTSSGLYLTNYGDSEHNSSLFIKVGGNVGIGEINPKNKLDVKGTIHSQEVKIDMLGWSDFVFKKEYDLPTLAEVEKQIKEKGHLENIPSEKEVLENGINLGEMNAKLLQKIEELTLYMIDIKKENDEMKVKQLKFEKAINELRKKSK
ncbi:hypothetical protein [Flavobacterium sp. WG21]|uniref:hypothetical protein n=1 Tax=Flavobacterium sp. WG21 TaxID=1229487 RepID=UPI0003496979|nr:hypothetical protein [Flavobacterium sp. WG21]